MTGETTLHQTPDQWAQTLKKGSVAAPESYYDTMAADYSATVGAWGYTMPAETAATLVRLLNDAERKACTVGTGAAKPLRLLDCGCGDGLVADALAGMTDVQLVREEAPAATEEKLIRIVGTDISQKMLDVAAGKRMYAELVKADGSTCLPFPEASYDALTCVGTTTYLQTDVLADWCRVVRGGGLILFTCKTALWVEWEAAMEALMQEGKWTHVYTSEPLHYLPKMSEEGRLEERVKVYAYRAGQK